MLFNVLQKTAVPAVVYLIGVAPVKHKFRHQILSELAVYMAHGENVVTVFRRLPVVRDAGGQGGMLHRGAVARPLLAHLLNKFAVPGFERVAALSPIEHKLGHGIGNKLWVDTGALQYLAGILTGLPIKADGGSFILHGLKRAAFLMVAGGLNTALKTTLKGTLLLLCIVLSEYPLTLHITEKAGVPVIAVRALFLPLQNKGIHLRPGKAARYAMLLKAGEGVFLRLPA
ncbi:MAG: hypothetical protein COB09_17410 [Thalassobium sp.]|nr:MAG: hypothetical protein COB09_17410 [Thalassobium sp.]